MEILDAMSKWVLLGYRRDGRPIYQIMGAADKDDESSDEETEDEESDIDVEGEPESEEDEEEQKPAAKKAPAKKAAAKSTGAGYETALARERAARKTAERQLRELRRKNETDAEKAEREAEENAEKRWRPAAIKAAARAALVEAKLKGDPGRAVKLIDLDVIDIDEDGEVSGLDEQIAELKKDYAELFETPVKKARPRADGAGKRPPNSEPKTSAEKIAAMYGMS